MLKGSEVLRSLTCPAGGVTERLCGAQVVGKPLGAEVTGEGGGGRRGERGAARFVQLHDHTGRGTSVHTRTRGRGHLQFVFFPFPHLLKPGFYCEGFSSIVFVPCGGLSPSLSLPHPPPLFFPEKQTFKNLLFFISDPHRSRRVPFTQQVHVRVFRAAADPRADERIRFLMSCLNESTQLSFFFFTQSLRLSIQHHFV